MIRFTKYAEQKFDILNKHKVFITREQVEDAVNLPEKLEKKNKYLLARKEGVKVIYKKESEINRISSLLANIIHH